MAYEVRISPRAQIEIDEALQYYAFRSEQAPRLFLASLTKAYQTLAIQPQLRKQYKEVRAINLQRFPFALYFSIDETNQLVYVL